MRKLEDILLNNTVARIQEEITKLSVMTASITNTLAIRLTVLYRIIELQEIISTFDKESQCQTESPENMPND